MSGIASHRPRSLAVAVGFAVIVAALLAAYAGARPANPASGAVSAGPSAWAVTSAAEAVATVPVDASAPVAEVATVTATTLLTAAKLGVALEPRHRLRAAPRRSGRHQPTPPHRR